MRFVVTVILVMMGLAALSQNVRLVGYDTIGVDTANRPLVLGITYINGDNLLVLNDSSVVVKLNRMKYLPGGQYPVHEKEQEIYFKRGDSINRKILDIFINQIRPMLVDTVKKYDWYKME